MVGISSKAAGTLQNKLKYNGKELQSNEFSDGSGLEWTDFGARMYDNQIGRWGVQDLMIEKHFSSSPYCYIYNNPIRFSDQFGLDTLLVDAKGNFSQNNLKGGKNDIIVKVSKKERQKGEINYNKKGGLKNSHIVSEQFDKESIKVTQKEKSTVINTTNGQSEKVFNFLADDSKVEFTLISYFSNNETKNIITTSHDEISEPYGTNLVTKMLDGGIELLSHTHNHPFGGGDSPSNKGNSSIDGASGDTGAYEKWSKKQPGGFKIYFRYNGITREFNVKGEEKLNNQ